MHAAGGASSDVGAVINQNANPCRKRQLCDGFSQGGYVTGRKIALANLHHINPGGHGAIQEINQEGQVRAGARTGQRLAVGYQVQQRRRAVLNQSLHFAIPSETRGRSF